MVLLAQQLGCFLAGGAADGVGRVDDTDCLRQPRFEPCIEYAVSHRNLGQTVDRVDVSRHWLGSLIVCRTAQTEAGTNRTPSTCARARLDTGRWRCGGR